MAQKNGDIFETIAEFSLIITLANIFFQNNNIFYVSEILFPNLFALKGYLDIIFCFSYIIIFNKNYILISYYSF